MWHRLLIVFLLGTQLALGQSISPAISLEKVRDTLLLKDPKGPHISEAYRYYT